MSMPPGMAEGRPTPHDIGINGYQDIAEIGRGGFAIVYIAWQRSFARQVAIKVISTVVDDTAMNRFERECSAIGALSGHPNIVTVYELGLTDDGRPFIVMEYLAGGSLSDRLLSAGPFGWQQLLDVGVRLAGALESAHRAGVVHRDIKPENVLVSRYAEPKLADFGIADVAGLSGTRSGEITATVAHAAPEVLRGERPTVASDVYSMGSTLFTLLSGDPPFVRAGDDSLIPLITRIASEPPGDLREVGAPEPLCEVLEGALAKRPSDRPASAAELGRQLQAVQAGAGLVPTPLTLEDYEMTPASRASVTVSAPVPRWRQAGAGGEGMAPDPVVPGGEGDRADGTALRRWSWRIVIGILAFALIVGALLRVLDNGSPTPDSTIFADNFSSSSSGWAQEDTQEATYSYAAGGYSIRVKKAPSTRISDTGLAGNAFRKDLLDLGNVSLEVDVQSNSSLSGAFGLMCRGKLGGPPAYLAAVNDKGFWGIFKYEDQRSVKTLTQGESPYEGDAGAGARHHLRLDCMGDPARGAVVLSLYANGKKLAEARDDKGLGPGVAGLVVYTTSEPGMEAKFDNFVVRGRS